MSETSTKERPTRVRLSPEAEYRQVGPGYPPTDRIGRIVPHGFNFLMALRAVPGLASFFDGKVPGEFWSVDVTDGGERVAVVACPCGEEPSIGQGRCVECECGRFYLWAGETIRVGRPDGVEPSLPSSQTPE